MPQSMANGLKCSVCDRVHMHYYDRQRRELPASPLFRAYVDRARAHARSGRGKRDATDDLTRFALAELRGLCAEHARVCDRWGELQALAAHAGLERELVWQRVKDAARFEEFETLAEFRRLARPGRLEQLRRTLGTVDDAAMRFFGAPSADELFWAVVRSGTTGCRSHPRTAPGHPPSRVRSRAATTRTSTAARVTSSVVTGIARGPTRPSPGHTRPGCSPL